jgi:hypothetical protein
MNNKFIFAVLLLPAILFSQPVNIAVLELEGNGVAKSDLGGLSNRLRTDLFKTEKFTVVERSKMDAILSEQGFQNTGCTDSECAVEIGQLIGVSKMIIGNVDKVGNIYSADIRMVDVGTGKIDKIASEECVSCSVGDVLQVTIHNVARKLAGLEADRVATPKPQVATASPSADNIAAPARPLYQQPPTGGPLFTTGIVTTSIGTLIIAGTIVATVMDVAQDDPGTITAWVVGPVVDIAGIIMLINGIAKKKQYKKWEQAATQK